MATKVRIGELKGFGKASSKAETHQKNYQVYPMFLPADITVKKGQGVVQVVTRQKFMDESIGTWIKYNSFRGLTAIAGIAAILLLPVNWILSAIAGMLAGYFYSQYNWHDFIINDRLKKRWLLEGT